MSSHLMRHLANLLLDGQKTGDGQPTNQSSCGVPYPVNSPLECRYLPGSPHGSTGTQVPKASQEVHVCCILATLPKTYHLHIPLGMCSSFPRFYNVKRLQEQSSPFQRDVFTDCLPTYQTCQRSKRDHQALIKSYRCPQCTHQPVPPTSAGGELHIQLFLGWWSTNPRRLLRKNKQGQSRQTSEENSSGNVLSFVKPATFDKRNTLASPEFNHLGLSSYKFNS